MATFFFFCEQLIYSVFASAASRGLLTRTMVEAGVVSAMANDPMLTLVRQASADKQVGTRLASKRFQQRGPRCE